MPVIIGLLPALAIETDLRLGNFALGPVSRLGQFGLGSTNKAAFRRLARMYARAHQFAVKHCTVLVQLDTCDSNRINAAGARAAVDCFAFAATIAGLRQWKQAGWGGIACPDYFHVSPIVPAKGVAYVYETSLTTAFASDAKHMKHVWPVEEANDPKTIRWDQNLLNALSPVVETIGRPNSDRRARQIVRSISLMNAAAAGFMDLMPAHADLARHISFAVAALETLCNEGSRSVNQGVVINQVDRVFAKNEDLSKPQFIWRVDKDSKKPLLTGRAGLAVHNAYDARNDYMHGNEIRANCLNYKGIAGRIPLIDPLMFIFRKLVIDHCLGFGGLILTTPCVAGDISEQLRRQREHFKVVEYEDENDNLLSDFLNV